jgi:hypothetical protein
MPATRSILVLLVWTSPLISCAQVLSNVRQRALLVGADTVQVDTLSLAPGSVQLFQCGELVDPALYQLDPYRATISFSAEVPKDSVLLRYRVLPLLFSTNHQRMDPAKTIRGEGARVDPFGAEDTRPVADPFALQGLNKAGSITRGIVVGNNRDLAVNSALNLELSGRLSERIGILASITDNNIPIQASGNTAELQDFDQVFIKVFDETRDLTAGDMVLTRPESHFMTYLKKTKGIGYQQRFDLNGNTGASASGSATISKGRWARNLLQGVEGIQGPYRLSGEQGESFIIVLSGTERVYIDGQLLVRGQENDYVIDYNAALITFTPNRLITKDRRIVVEFQYGDRNYARSLVQAGAKLPLGKTTVRVNLYSEQDQRQQPFQQSLSDADKLALASAGDDPLKAVVPGVDSAAFVTEAVQYKQVDSLGYSPVYVYSTSADSAFYRITFSAVGAGQGDYSQAAFTPNGRVYQWVAPDTLNGAVVKKGDHAPVRVLIAPQQQQMATVAAERNHGKAGKTRLEAAASNYDRNTFSTIGSSDDGGVALMAAHELQHLLDRTDTTQRVIAGFQGEVLSEHFAAIERFRSVEFDRNWNLRGVTPVGDQILLSAYAGMAIDRLGTWRYSFNTFQVREGFSGAKQDLTADLRAGRWELKGGASYLRVERPDESAFLRHKGTLKYDVGPFRLGVQSEHELNEFRNDTANGPAMGSYQFHEWEAFLQAPDSSSNDYKLWVGQRWDEAVADGELTRSALARSYGASLQLARDPRRRTQVLLTYRNLAIPDTSLTVQRPEDTYLGRLDQSLSILKGAALFDLFYELGSGLEQQREFIYAQVAPGQGVYIWNDYNGDGIQQLNEFETANFGYEADFIRVFVPSTQFVRTFKDQMNASVDLRPQAVWTEAKGAKGALAKFSDIVSLSVDRNSSGRMELAKALRPWQLDPADTTLLSYTSSVRNTIYYDRTGRRWSLDHTYQNDRSRSLLVNGFEARARRSDLIRLRVNPLRALTSELELETGSVSNSSDLLQGRSYAIQRQAYKPKVTWQPGTVLRASAFFRVTEKNNREELGGEFAQLRDLGSELRYSSPGKGSITATFNWIATAYNGEVNTPLGNEMLEGLKPGDNLTWGISIQRNLSGHLQVDVTYNGRSSEGSPTVHVGSAQVRASF